MQQQLILLILVLEKKIFASFLAILSFPCRPGIEVSEQTNKCSDYKYTRYIIWYSPSLFSGFGCTSTPASLFSHLILRQIICSVSKSWTTPMAMHWESRTLWHCAKTSYQSHGKFKHQWLTQSYSTMAALSGNIRIWPHLPQKNFWYPMTIIKVFIPKCRNRYVRVAMHSPTVVHVPFPK